MTDVQTLLEMVFEKPATISTLLRFVFFQMTPLSNAISLTVAFTPQVMMKIPFADTFP